MNKRKRVIEELSQEGYFDVIHSCFLTETVMTIIECCNCGRLETVELPSEQAAKYFYKEGWRENHVDIHCERCQ